MTGFKGLLLKFMKGILKELVEDKFIPLVDNVKGVPQKVKDDLKLQVRSFVDSL